MRALNGLLFALFAGLQFQLWVGEGSLGTLWSLEDAIESQRADNELLGQRNARLAAEVADLQKGLETVEATARRDLGMVGRDETFYHLVRDSSALN